MATTREILTISLPKDEAKNINKITKQKGISRSQFIRDAIRTATLKEEWERLTRIGERIAKKMNIESYDDIERIFGRS